ncbi:MAG: ABC transporter permease [Acidimicrobiia bacterium]|nr:ABC transporter permease [Acidimicrobiia bacterium]MDH3397580.1 ABC transporter permease [Acidimicrobiia bacterium]MDH5615408.1 ABC transporter permease [Acidimicrobiia bacterium]
MLATVFTKTTRDRWKGMAIAVISLALLLLMAMSVYRDIDLSIYTELPEVFLSLMGIPDGADVASLAVGVLYGFYGALTLAGLAVSMGSASVAGEERDGTIGLLLGNPKSRTNVLVSKAASMLLLVGLGALALWGTAPLVAGILDVRMGGMQMGAYALHLFVNAIFYGFLAMAIGAWTGKRGLASGVTAGVMALGFVAVGIFPIIEGWENVAKAFPWNYFDNGQPVINGIQWGDLSVLLVASVVLAAIALVGVNRRDLRGQNVGVTLLDRLRANPMTQKVVDRLAGATRVSRIWIKTASEHQGLLIITAYLMFFVMGVLMGPLYGLMDKTLLSFADQIPKELYAFVGAGGGSMSTAEGFYEVETFGLMAPIAVMVVTVVIGAQALAGEEQDSTMGLLLANPIKRSRVLLEKAWAMVVYAIAVGFFTFAGVWLGSLIGGLGIGVGNIAATSFLATLVGLAFGALALALSAATGRVKVAVFGTVGVALVFHLVNSFASLNDTLAAWARWTPFNYYLNSHPLVNGMRWGDAAVLTGLTVVLVALSVVLFQRRDLRQTG